MTKEKEQGLFWLPTNPEVRVDGEITLDDENGPILKTYGELAQSGPLLDKQKVIDGFLADDHIKLVNCFTNSSSIGQAMTWYCELAFRGDEYSGDVPSRISSVETTIESLGDWTPGFEGIRLAEDRSSLSWPVNQPDQSSRWKLGVVSLHQETFPSFNASRYAIKNATVALHTSAQISFDEPQSWEVAVGTVQNLQALVSIAKGEPVHIERTSIVDVGTRDAKLTALYRPILQRRLKQIPHSELFTMQELGGVQGVAKWLNVLCGQESLITALLIDRYQQPALITDRTGHLLTACEAYQRHRMASPNKRINNFSKEILDPMLSIAGPQMEEWVGNLDKWKSRIAKVRNNHGVGHLQAYGSHYSASPDFHLINQQLYLLVVICLLAECEVSKGTLGNVVERMRSTWKMRLI